MKLSIEKNLLVSALQVITPITDKSSSKPILSNFLLEAILEGGEGIVKLSATDYEISIRGEFAAKVEEPGVACISARKVLEVCRELKSKGKDSPIVIICTARNTRPDILTALRAGADDYIVKPFTREIITQKIAQLLEQREGRS